MKKIVSILLVALVVGSSLHIANIDLNNSNANSDYGVSLYGGRDDIYEPNVE